MCRFNFQVFFGFLCENYCSEYRICVNCLKKDNKRTFQFVKKRPPQISSRRSIVLYEALDADNSTCSKRTTIRGQKEIGSIQEKKRT